MASGGKVLDAEDGPLAINHGGDVLILVGVNAADDVAR
jgi:hypothetical protein